MNGIPMGCRLFYLPRTRMITNPLFYIGLWMQQRITDSMVYRLANILLFLTGSKLIWDSVSMLRKLGSL